MYQAAYARWTSGRAASFRDFESASSVKPASSRRLTAEPHTNGKCYHKVRERCSLWIEIWIIEKRVPKTSRVILCRKSEVLRDNCTQSTGFDGNRTPVTGALERYRRSGCALKQIKYVNCIRSLAMFVQRALHRRGLLDVCWKQTVWLKRWRVFVEDRQFLTLFLF